MDGRIFSGVAYKNERITEKPWSIHIARIDRSKSDIELQSVHARGKALGVATLSSMVSYARKQMGVPLVGVNGDYYQMRGRPFEGDARGLQVMDGELLSGPPLELLSGWMQQGSRTWKVSNRILRCTGPMAKKPSLE